MQVTLDAKTAALVEMDMATGRYASLDEYIALALTTLHEREQWLLEERALIEASCVEAERGELMDEDDVRKEMLVMKDAFLARLPAA